MFLSHLITLITLSGLIHVYNPDELVNILPKYYGHSKYASFRRQLRNYGFYQSPHKRGDAQSFAHRDATKDVHSILRLEVYFFTCEKLFILHS